MPVKSRKQNEVPALPSQSKNAVVGRRAGCGKPLAAPSHRSAFTTDLSRGSPHPAQPGTCLNPHTTGLGREKTAMTSVLFTLMSFEGFPFTKDITNASCRLLGKMSYLEVIEKMFCRHLQTLSQIAFFSN